MHLLHLIVTIAAPPGGWPTGQTSAQVFDSYVNSALAKYNRKLTTAEKTLYESDRLSGLRCMYGGMQAYNSAEDNYEQAALEDGNGDAFRHALWNWNMANDVGQNFAQKWGDAHEELPGNTGTLKKKMDSYNNAVGRQLAKDNPNAESLADKTNVVKQAVRNGQMTVIVNGALVPSNSSGEKP